MRQKDIDYTEMFELKKHLHDAKFKLLVIVCGLSFMFMLFVVLTSESLIVQVLSYTFIVITIFMVILIGFMQ
jgi:hypothetical protein